MEYSMKFIKKEPYKQVFIKSNEDTKNKSVTKNEIDTNKNTKLNEAKKICSELGFKANSENFGNCVLKLIN